MMLLHVVLTLLVCSAHAAVPQGLQVRAAATCNRDNCFREVFGTAVAGRSAQGSKDCTSYLQGTVTPCAITKTSTVTVTTAGGTISTTTTTTSTVSAVGATLTTTSTVMAASTPTITKSETKYETKTVTITVTSLFTQTGPGLEKRTLEARATSACPVTNSATATTVPAYASDCTGTRFSSVCSCNGNVPTATTLPASTTTTKQTSTKTTTATSTITATSIVTPANTATSTVTTTVTMTPPAVYTTTYITSTETTTTTSLTAVVVTVEPTCTASSPTKVCSDGSECVLKGKCTVVRSQAGCDALCGSCVFQSYNFGIDECVQYYNCCP